MGSIVENIELEGILHLLDISAANREDLTVIQRKLCAIDGKDIPAIHKEALMDLDKGVSLQLLHDLLKTGLQFDLPVSEMDDLGLFDGLYIMDLLRPQGNYCCAGSEGHLALFAALDLLPKLCR